MTHRKATWGSGRPLEQVGIGVRVLQRLAGCFGVAASTAHAAAARGCAAQRPELHGDLLRLPLQIGGRSSGSQLLQLLLELFQARHKLLPLFFQRRGAGVGPWPVAQVM